MWVMKIPAQILMLSLQAVYLLSRLAALSLLFHSCFLILSLFFHDRSYLSLFSDTYLLRISCSLSVPEFCPCYIYLSEITFSLFLYKSAGPWKLCLINSVHNGLWWINCHTNLSAQWHLSHLYLLFNTDHLEFFLIMFACLSFIQFSKRTQEYDFPVYFFSTTYSIIKNMCSKIVISWIICTLAVLCFFFC